MDVEKYVDEMKEFYKFILDIFDNDYQTDIIQINYYLDNKKLEQNHEKLKHFLYLLSKVSENHHKKRDFYDIVYHIILYYQNPIRQIFTNTEIFHLFKFNKPIIHFLIKNKILVLDKNLINEIIEKSKYFRRF